MRPRGGGPPRSVGSGRGLDGAEERIDRGSEARRQIRPDERALRVRQTVRPQTLSAWLSPSDHPRGFAEVLIGRGRPLPSGSIATVPLSPVFPNLELQ